MNLSLQYSRLARRAVLGLVIAVLMMVFGAAPALAAPETASTAVAGKTLPKGLPNDLKKYIAGTEEFKSAAWFKGACADKGGDVAGYIAALFRDEPRMNYWRLTADDRASYLVKKSKQADGSEWSQERATKAVTDGFVPSGAWLNDTYPGPRTSDYPSTSAICAEDFQTWTTKTVSAWGFQWADKPDDTSLDRMQDAAGDEKKGKDLRTRILDPCGADIKNGSSFCDHAYYVNCDKADRGESATQCQAWNVGVARLFLGTSTWIEKNMSFTDRLWWTTGASDMYKFGKGAASAFAAIWTGIAKVVDFVANPGNGGEEWANTFKSGALDMTLHVLPGLAAVGEFDFRAAWFLKWYAISVSLGMAVMSVMFILATVQAGRRGGATMMARESMGYLPMGLALMLYTPMIAAMVQALAHAFTTQITGLMGGSMDTAVNDISTMLGGLTDKTLLGGVLGGLFGFAALAIGAFALYLGLLMHQIGLPLASVACAIGYGMLVHPRWRAKALRVPMMLLSLILSTPLLFFILWGILQIITWSAAESTTGDGKLASLGGLALCALAFIVVGLAPFSLLKWSPLLPNSEDADRMGDTGGGNGMVLGAGLGGAMSASRAGHERTAGGRGGGPSGSASGAEARHAINTKGGGQSGSPGHRQGVGALGKAATAASAVGGPVTGAAARLAAAAGKGVQKTGDVAKAGVGAGARASAMAASNRVHGVAADSAPSADQT